MVQQLTKNGQITVEGTTFLPLIPTENDSMAENVANQFKQNYFAGTLESGFKGIGNARALNSITTLNGMNLLCRK